MPRAIHRLSARTVETLQRPGRHADGGNLYLSISANGGKRWVFFYELGGRQREMGLGSAAKGQISLADARKAAAEARQCLQSGRDPLELKGAKAIAKRVIPTFGTFADEYVETHRSKWRNEKHVAQWVMTLKKYCDAIRDLPIDAVDTDAILKVLKPLWAEVPETASRLRGRIEKVLSAAKAMGYRSGENPARWSDHLNALLPARQGLTRGHHAALPYDHLPQFMTALRARHALAALALELCILTVTRTSEVLEAELDEFDLEKAIWTIPAKRMKAGHEHRIPLSPRAVEILKSLFNLPPIKFVFPGNAKGKPLSSKAMTMQLQRMDRRDITVHGFRSTFRDWASEQTSFPHETCEHALAHRISDRAEAAYRRGDQFEKRRKLMDAWAAFSEADMTSMAV